MAQAIPNAAPRIPVDQVKTRLATVLCNHGFTPDTAGILADTFTENSLDGVYTHGLNRFPRFIELVKKGHVRVAEQAVLKNACGALEQWDGRLAPGISNALDATDRAMQLAQAHGLGCVALANTNHWMRGGTYGWRAASRGFVFIGWSNTIANMPAWGAVDARLGNNPLVLAVPHGDQAVVLDMAMSQYSYGAMETHQRNQELLAMPGGYDAAGNLSRDPAAILESQRALPVGYWKGAGLSLLLDILATVLSGGLSTAEISRQEAEYAVSQVFIAMDTRKLGQPAALRQMVINIIEDYRQSQPLSKQEAKQEAKQDGGHAKIHYPGESALHHRHTNLRDGIPVDERLWAEICAL